MNPYLVSTAEASDYPRIHQLKMLLGTQKKIFYHNMASIQMVLQIIPHLHR